MKQIIVMPNILTMGLAITVAISMTIIPVDNIQTHAGYHLLLTALIVAAAGTFLLELLQITRNHHSTFVVLALLEIGSVQERGRHINFTYNKTGKTSQFKCQEYYSNSDIGKMTNVIGIKTRALKRLIKTFERKYEKDYVH